MKLVRKGRRVEISYQVSGQRFHRSWSDKEAMARELHALFSLRDRGVDISELVRAHSESGRMPSVQNVGTPGTISFKTFVNEKYCDYRLGMLSPNSKLREKQRLSQLVTEFGSMMLHEVDAERVERFRREYPDLKKTRKVKRASTASALNHMVKPLKALFKTAAAWGYLCTNPLSTVRLHKESPGRDRYITIEGFRALYTRATDELKPWLVLAAYTGLRRSAMVALTRNDIDGEARELIVRNSKGRSYRVYLHDEVFKLLEGLDLSLIDTRILRGPEGQPASFPYRDFRVACKLAGLVDLRFHDLRHTFATWLRSAGVDPMTVAQLLGHRVQAMTGRYAHLTPEQRRRSVEVLPPLSKGDERTEKCTTEVQADMLLVERPRKPLAVNG